MTGTRHPELDLRRSARLLGRALRLRCPHCGRGQMFDRWVVMRPFCTHCHIRFDRGEHDFFIGAYLVNLIVAELIVVASIVIGAVVTWPDVPWNLLKYLLLPVAVLFPLLTYPFSKAVWLAIDLTFQPTQDSDFRSAVSRK
jgi:uncharacterized protein (DUF983 family)